MTAKINKLATHKPYLLQAPDLKKITIDGIHDPFLKTKNIAIDVLRLDTIHPVISGNKWFKLKYHLDNYNAGNYKGILTFGGAWSNHIIATACTCHLKKIACAGIIRGEKPPQLSPTLTEAMKYGMQLKFISRDLYKMKDDAEVSKVITSGFHDYYMIPEGGAGAEGEKGASGIIDLLPVNDYTHIVCAVGTGTMLNGTRISALPQQKITGIVVLKGWKEDNAHGKDLFYDYHFGGYAKHTAGLISFMNEFYTKTNIPTDIVYTGKLAFAIFDLVKKDHFPPQSKILMIHSGGLQGNASLQKGSLIF